MMMNFVCYHSQSNVSNHLSCAHQPVCIHARIQRNYHNNIFLEDIRTYPSYKPQSNGMDSDDCHNHQIPPDLSTACKVANLFDSGRLVFWQGSHVCVSKLWSRQLSTSWQIARRLHPNNWCLVAMLNHLGTYYCSCHIIHTVFACTM